MGPTSKAEMWHQFALLPAFTKSRRYTSPSPLRSFRPKFVSYRRPWRRRRSPEATCSSSEASYPPPLTHPYVVPTPGPCRSPGGAHLSRPSGSLPSAPWHRIPATVTERSSRPAFRRCSSSFARPRRGLPPPGTSPFRRLPSVGNPKKQQSSTISCWFDEYEFLIVCASHLFEFI